MFQGKHACPQNLRGQNGQNILLQTISKVLIIITISSQNASLPPRYDVLVDAVLDAAIAGLLHLGRHFFNLTLTSKGILFQRGSLPLDLSRPFSQKAREALFFFFFPFLVSAFLRGVSREDCRRRRFLRGPSRSFGRTDGDGPAGVRAHRSDE